MFVGFGRDGGEPSKQQPSDRGCVPFYGVATALILNHISLLNPTHYVDYHNAYPPISRGSA